MPTVVFTSRDVYPDKLDKRRSLSKLLNEHAGAFIPMMHMAYSIYLFSFNLPFLCLIYVLLLPPYFDHDAFIHHALRVGLLDASENEA